MLEGGKGIYTSGTYLIEDIYIGKIINTQINENKVKFDPIWGNGFSSALLLEETDKGLLLRKKEESKLSWKDTFKAMAEEKEDWDDFDTALLDGLEEDNFDN